MPARRDVVHFSICAPPAKSRDLCPTATLSTAMWGPCGGLRGGGVGGEGGVGGGGLGGEGLGTHGVGR